MKQGSFTNFQVDTPKELLKGQNTVESEVEQHHEQQVVPVMVAKSGRVSSEPNQSTVLQA